MSFADHIALSRLRNAVLTDFAFGELAREIQQANLPWRRHYAEYQSGGWWTCSLLGSSGDATNGEVRDTTDPVETDALAQLPTTRDLLRNLPLHYMTARLARLDPSGALWEHRDYQDLQPVGRHRIHLPIETNQNAFLVSGGQRYHMDSGVFWIFRPTDAHGACNGGERPRLHLIMDVYDNEYLHGVLRADAPCSPIPMPELSLKETVDKVRRLRIADKHKSFASGTDPGRLADWESAALNLYFSFAAPEGSLYRAIERVCSERGNIARAHFWRTRCEMMLGKGINEDA
jgi:hypothetical protein